MSRWDLAFAEGVLSVLSLVAGRGDESLFEEALGDEGIDLLEIAVRQGHVVVLRFLQERPGILKRLGPDWQGEAERLGITGDGAVPR